jgi:hypothetical protein
MATGRKGRAREPEEKGNYAPLAPDLGCHDWRRHVGEDVTLKELHDIEDRLDDADFFA